MKISKMLAVLILMGAVTPMVMADSCKRCTSCGKKICMTEETKTKVKKTYYDIECKEICLPPARFLPIFGKKDCSCEEKPKARRRRTVRKLVKKSYECEELRYKFHVAEMDLCDECRSHGGHCSEGELVTPHHSMVIPEGAAPAVPQAVQQVPQRTMPAATSAAPRQVAPQGQGMPAAYRQYPVNHLQPLPSQPRR